MHFPDPCGIHPQVDRVAASAANTRAQLSSRPEEDQSGMLLIRNLAARYAPYLLPKCEGLHSRVVKSLTQARPAVTRPATTAGNCEKWGKRGLCHAGHMTGKGLTKWCRSMYTEFLHFRTQGTGWNTQFLRRAFCTADDPARLTQHPFNVRTLRGAQINRSGFRPTTD